MAHNIINEGSNRATLGENAKRLINEKFPRRTQGTGLQDQRSDQLERTVLGSQVLIIEGISGSGKDTLQRYLKRKLKGRDVYDYSEGELLQSWNQLQIKGIFNIQIKLMKLFVNYMRDIIRKDENAVFLLNRFHLSAYVLAVTKQPRLEKEYDEIINSLKTLPVHIFILQLDENEIEKRSLHPERSGAWQKFQQQIVLKEGFSDRLQRYTWQQQLMLEAAERQKLPYSVMKFPSAISIEGGWGRISESRKMVFDDAHINGGIPRSFRRKRSLPQNT